MRRPRNTLKQLIYSVSDQNLRNAAESSDSVRAILKKLNLPTSGRAWEILEQHLQHLDIKYHKAPFSSKGRYLGKPVPPLTDILNGTTPYAQKSLKKRLIQEGFLKNKCALCDQSPIWKENPLVMVLDHKNGNHTDNSLENLRLLCPNCHSQTPTFCRNHKKKTSHSYKIPSWVSSI